MRPGQSLISSCAPLLRTSIRLPTAFFWIFVTLPRFLKSASPLRKFRMPSEFSPLAIKTRVSGRVGLVNLNRFRPLYNYGWLWRTVLCLRHTFRDPQWSRSPGPDLSSAFYTAFLPSWFSSKPPGWSWENHQPFSSRSLRYSLRFRQLPDTAAPASVPTDFKRHS